MSCEWRRTLIPHRQIPANIARRIVLIVRGDSRTADGDVMACIVPKTQRFAAALSLAFFMTSFASGASNPDWFPKKDLMTIGAYYYPEAWPEAQWSRDMRNIRKLGMEFVHM